MTRTDILMHLAQAVTQQMPDHLADAVIVIGSVSFNRADQFSDLDLLCLIENYAEAETYRRWLESLGAVALRPMRHQADRSIWLEYHYQDEDLNLKWLSWDTINQQIQAVQDAIANFTMPDSEGLLFAWMIHHAIAMKNHPKFETLQAEVTPYPIKLTQIIIEHHLRIWKNMLNVPDIFSAKAVAKRREVPDFRRRHLLSISSILAVLYAYNRQWLPDDKWWLAFCEDLPHKPDNFAERIRTILSGQDLVKNIDDLFALFIDMLNLLNANFDVERLISPMQAIRDSFSQA